jgi:ankyrin repeat protein
VRRTSDVRKDCSPHGVQVSTNDSKGNSPLSIAQKPGHGRIAEYLVSVGALQ